MTALCEALSAAMQQTGVFPLGGIRVRAHPMPHYAIADGDPRNAFVDLVLRMGKGRTEEARKAAGDHVMEAAKTFFADRMTGGHFALALEIVEIAMSWKANTIHARLKGESG